MSRNNHSVDILTQLRIIRQEREAYLRQLQLLNPAPEPKDWVQKAIRYIHKHFFEDTCSVQHLKDGLRIRDHNFSSLFKH